MKKSKATDSPAKVGTIVVINVMEGLLAPSLDKSKIKLVPLDGITARDFPPNTLHVLINEEGAKKKDVDKAVDLAGQALGGAEDGLEFHFGTTSVNTTLANLLKDQNGATPDIKTIEQAPPKVAQDNHSPAIPEGVPVNESADDVALSCSIPASLYNTLALIADKKGIPLGRLVKEALRAFADANK